MSRSNQEDFVMFVIPADCKLSGLHRRAQIRPKSHPKHGTNWRKLGGSKGSTLRVRDRHFRRTRLLARLRTNSRLDTNGNGR